MTTIAGTTRTAETKHRAKRQGAKPKALDGGQCTLDLSRFAVSRRPIDRVDGGAACNDEKHHHQDYGASTTRERARNVLLPKR
jgi:hypothetical protein